MDAGASAPPDGGTDAGPPSPPDADALPPPPRPAALDPIRVQELTVVGTREKQTAGSAHIVKAQELERLEQDNPEAVLKAVPGVYSRGEDGFGLRPNIGLRGVNPERSKKVTLMEDGVLFGPAPYSAPAAYYFPLVTRMESVRVIKGPAAVSFGPQTVVGAIDFVTRRIPAAEAGAADLAAGQYGYGKLHAYYGANTRTQGFLIEGLHLRSDGFKELDGGGDTGFERNEWMVKARRALTSGGNTYQELSLKLGYSDEDSRETYLGLSDADLRDTPLKRYQASRLDRMRWHRTAAHLRHMLDFGQGRSIETTVYRHDFDRSWRKVNRFGDKRIAEVLADPTGAQNLIYYRLLRGELDSSTTGETIFIGPNRRGFVSQGMQSVGSLRLRGSIDHRLEVGLRLHYDRIDRHHSEEGFVVRGGALAPDGGATMVTADERDWATAIALWAADALTWKGVTLTPGLRTELIKTWSRDRLHGREAEGALQRVVIPGLGAYLGLTPSLGLLAGVHRGFSPAAPGQPSHVEPETSWNYEAGARLAGPTVRLEAIGFFNDYRNLTSVCALSSGCAEKDLDRQFNAGRAHIWGVEAFGQADVRLPREVVLPLQAAYTVTRTELLEDFVSEDPQLGRVEAGDELAYVPRHQIRASVGVESPRFRVFGAATYVSATREEAGQGEIPPSLRTDGSFVLDATARIRAVGSLWLYLQARNALGASDIASRRPYGARPIAPRWVQVGLKVGL
jgi:Fe(3+) dicitrate transport protein